MDHRVVVVELVGGSDGPALTLARDTLAAGKALVTADEMAAKVGVKSKAKPAAKAARKADYEAKTERMRVEEAAVARAAKDAELAAKGLFDKEYVTNKFDVKEDKFYTGKAGVIGKELTNSKPIKVQAKVVRSIRPGSGAGAGDSEVGVALVNAAGDEFRTGFGKTARDGMHLMRSHAKKAQVEPRGRGEMNAHALAIAEARRETSRRPRS